MFETLTKGFRNARNKLAGVTELTEENIEQPLRQVRLALLEADVELGVVKGFLSRVREAAVGREVRTRAEKDGKVMKVGAAEQFIKICQDELEAMMSWTGEPVTFVEPPAFTGIMMVGLQGAGKTTTSGKLALLLQKEHKRKPLLVAADVQRPGAVEQLKVLGEQVGVPVFSLEGAEPIEICRRAMNYARKMKRDTIIYDTAGRLAIDEQLMGELGEIHRFVKPENVFLVVDAMIGQDSVKTAAAFHTKLGLSGVVLTKLDGDARGGAAISVKQVTGAPVKFVGMGEGMDKLEQFRPEGMASRILGMGDVVGLMKDFENVVDQDQAEQDAQRMLQGQFTLDDFLSQIETIQKMGPMQDIFEKLPFFGDSVPEGFQVDEGELGRTKAIVYSMTPDERRNIELFQKQPNRLKRVAKGSGREVKDVAELLQRFGMMRGLMGSIGQQAGMLSKIPGLKQMAAARQLRNVVKTGGLDHNPMMASLADQLLEAAVAGEGMMPPPSALAAMRAGKTPKVVNPKREAQLKAKRKNARKKQKKARKKSRK